MATLCGSYARGKMMRITKLDECGTPVLGPTSSLVSKGFVNVDPVPNYTDPDAISQTDANGDNCINDQAASALNWVDLTIVMCNVDPYAVNLITGNPLVVDDATPTPNTTGYRLDAGLTGTANFALELWSGVTGQACGAGGQAYGYWLFPFVVQGKIGEGLSITNAGLTLTMTARTQAGSGWGVGPYNVRTDGTDAPAPLLTAIGPAQHMHFEQVVTTLPTPGCGAVALAELEGLVEGLVLEPA